MDSPVIAQTSPFPIEVEEGKTEEGKTYFWCACGKSKNQPFCDGSHKGTTFTPVKFEAEHAAKVFFCGCKHTRNAPMCDGTHKTLESG